MTIVVTPLSGSEKLCLREGNVFPRTELDSNEPIMGEDRGICWFREFIMETDFLIEWRATPTSIDELKEIWDQWGNETKQLFYGNYGDLPYLLNVQIDERLFRALAQFWNPAYSCFTFGEVDLVPTVEEYTALLRCPRDERVVDYYQNKEKGECRALGYVDEATTDLFHRLSKRVTSVPAILAETFRSLGTCRKAGTDRFVGCAQLLPDRGEWIALLQNLQSKDVEWRAPWMIPGEILYRCGNFDWFPLLGIWGAIGYALLLVLRQFGLRQFVPTNHGLTQSEFAYRGADYKKRVGEISSAWNKTCRLKGVVAIGPATTPEYVEWRGRRINDNIPEPDVEGARPMEEYLQVMPLELEIMKQELRGKNLELEKMIAKLEEEKIYLSLDIDVQKMEVEKERKEKRKIEEDRDDLKEHYKKAQVSLRRAKVGGSSDQLQKEVQEGKARAEYWERKFQEMQSRNLALEEENKGLKSKINELGRSLRWHRNHDSTVELKELKNKVEDLETALQ
ncbi:hypothetical protein CXB51_025491 [Gossypium anomalum]|uniref:DUF7745 domain-containing protein n=1 Tax=Gossypium anomalum TaxID=47600 RepID=A0A8J5Y3D6_9ROSI|nr:hypothetical protein CXB51_025491 [Gossypium anomalum]